MAFLFFADADFVVLQEAFEEGLDEVFFVVCACADVVDGAMALLDGEEDFELFEADPLLAEALGEVADDVDFFHCCVVVFVILSRRFSV